MLRKIYIFFRNLYLYTIEKTFLHRVINNYIGAWIVSILGPIKGFRFRKTDNLGYKIILLFDLYEQKTVKVFRSMIKPGMVIFDIGASLGYYTKMFSEMVGISGKVYAFEPEKENFKLLVRNSDTKYKNTVCVNKGVSDAQGSAEFYKSAISGLHSLNKDKNALEKVTIEITSLKEFVKQNSISRVDFIKIDVEGAEIKVLRGMPDFVKNSDEVKIVVEVNPETLERAGDSEKTLLSLIANMGFKIEMIEKYEEGSYNILCYKGEK